MAGADSRSRSEEPFREYEQEESWKLMSGSAQDYFASLQHAVSEGVHAELTVTISGKICLRCDLDQAVCMS